MKNLFSQILGSVALVVAGGLLLSLEVRAQQQAPTGPKKEPSQKVSEGLPKLKEYTEANPPDTPKALALLDELLKVGDQGDSYDQALLNLYKGNLTLPLEDTRGAVAPLERVIDITSRVDLLPVQDIKGVHKNLAIVYYVSMQAKDMTDAQRVINIGKAIAHLEAYFKLNGEPTADEAYQYSSFLFTQATLGKEGDNVDLPTIKRAREAAQKGVLKDTTRFRTDLYNLILTAYQYEKNAEASAEIVELLLARAPSAPENVRYWQLLPHAYLGLANEAADKHDEDRANEFRYRAILAYERGHKYAGLFNAEKGEDSTMDILNLSKTYYDVGQIEKGAEVMLEAVRAKKIKGDLGARAWIFIATYYQQLGKDDKAIAILKEAASNFPQDGQFDFQLANTYFSLEQNDDAIKAIAEAVRKGVPGRMPTVYLSQAYYLYSANSFKAASEAASKGMALPNVPASVIGQLKQLKDAADVAEASKEAARSKL